MVTCQGESWDCPAPGGPPRRGTAGPASMLVSARAASLSRPASGGVAPNLPEDSEVAHGTGGAQGAEQEVRRGPRRQGREPHHPRQGIHGPRRSLRLRQDHHPAHGGGPRGDHRRRDLHRRARGQRSAPQGPRHRDGVPELRALPAHERVRQHGVRPEDAEVPQARDPEAGAGRGGDPRHPGAAQAEAASALGRPAPAGGGGPRHRAPSAGVPLRRAAVQPRRQAPRPDAGGAQAAARAARDHRHLRHPRPGGGHDPGQPGGGDEGRVGAAGGRAHGDLQPAAEQVRGRLHRLSGDELHPGHHRGGGRQRSTRRPTACGSRCPRRSRPGSAPTRASPSPSASARRISGSARRTDSRHHLRRGGRRGRAARRGDPPRRHRGRAVGGGAGGAQRAGDARTRRSASASCPSACTSSTRRPSRSSSSPLRSRVCQPSLYRRG